MSMTTSVFASQDYFQAMVIDNELISLTVNYIDSILNWFLFKFFLIRSLDNLCYKAGNDESSSGIINAFVLIFVAFALFFAIMLYEGVLNNGRHGSQGDVNILGEQSRKKLFPNSKRRL